MPDSVIVLVLASVLVWWSTPRLFRYADGNLARQHLGTIISHRGSSSAPLVAKPTTNPANNPSLIDLASLCDSVARATRGGTTASQAMSACLLRHAMFGGHWTHLVHDDSISGQFHDSMTSAEQMARNNGAHDDALCLSLISLAIIDNNLVPAALDHASAVLRDIAACRADLKVAASQAHLSARMLTVLPFVLSGAAIVISSTFRNSLVHPPVAACLMVGLALNHIGWRWISRHISDALWEQENIGHLLTDHLCVSLRAGFTITQACERWSGTSHIGEEVAELLQNGHSLEDALQPLAESSVESSRNLADVVLQAERDGLPVISTINRLASESRSDRRRVIDVRIRQLPTRLSIPLVVCVLPSFLFMSVAPLVLASISTFTVSLPLVAS